MVRSKLDEHKLQRRAARATCEPGETFECGPFGDRDGEDGPLDPRLVRGRAHLRPRHDARHRRLQVRPDAGRRDPGGRRRGWPSSAARALLLLCGDSTNVTARAWPPSESSVGPHLEEAFARCDGRIVVTCFASNIHRVQQVVDAAAALGRKVALVGRSMRKNVNIGRTLGHIDIPEGMLVGAARDRGLPRPQARGDLHRQPGRAAVGAAPDGARRPPAGRAARRRHGRCSPPRRSRATSAR